MSQHSATVVVLASEHWDRTKLCLETLRPTLGVRDQAIVVDRELNAMTEFGMRQFPWAKVITLSPETTVPAATNAAAAEVVTDLVVFLDDDVVLPAKWLDGLRAAFEDERVGAAGPCTNTGTGEQAIATVEYALDRMSAFRKWARDWRSDHRGQRVEVETLFGWCLAVRKDTFQAVGGFDETAPGGNAQDYAISSRVRGTGALMLLCRESFVHRQGKLGDTFAISLKKKSGLTLASERTQDNPLLSACMIIKDEVEILSRCLSSLNGVVDEVVIYDTGSTDGSIELAQAAGATVIEGYWDNDFGRARNQALAECKGDWILHIDADEVFEGDPIAIRSILEGTDMEALAVDIENLTDGNKNNMIHRPCRLFRRDVFHWAGRLHEQIVKRDGAGQIAVAVAPNVRLIHYGYLNEIMEAKNKAVRNIEIAQLDVDTDDERDEMDKRTNLARSLTLAGRNEEAYEILVQSRELDTNSPVVRRTLMRSGAQVAMVLGKGEEALEWVDRYDEAATIRDSGRYMRGQAYAILGRWKDALGELEGLDENMQDDDGLILPLFGAQTTRASAYANLELWEKACDEYVGLATDDAHNERVWAQAVSAFWKAERNMMDLMGVVSPKHLNAVFGQLRHAPPEAADIALECLFEFPDRQASVLALAIRVAPQLTVERALEWAARLHLVGQGQQSPLMSIAYDTSRPAMDRLQAAAASSVVFHDKRAENALKLAAGSLEESEFENALFVVQEISPRLLEPLVLGAATKPQRSIAMGRALYKLGADSEGVAIVMLGLEQGADEAVANDIIEWLESEGRTEEAEAIRAAGASARE